MKKTLSLLLLALALVAPGLKAQVVTTEPSPLQESSTDVKIYFHADQGNRGLANKSADTKLWAHTWAKLSNGKQIDGPDWNKPYADKYLLQYQGPNLWMLYIGNIRQYYGLTDPTVNITQLGFVFRDASGNKGCGTEGNGDIFVDVLDEGLQVSLEANPSSNVVNGETGPVTFSALCTTEAALSITVNSTTLASGNGKAISGQYTFSTPGDYTVTAKATANGQTVTAVKNICYAMPSAQKAYPGGTPVMGPVKNSDGSVTFCIAAPGKQSLIIVGAWNDYLITNQQVMNYTDANVNGASVRYFWYTVPNLDPDTMYGYFFIVDGETEVGDPYGKLAIDPWNDQWISNDIFPNIPPYPQDKMMTTTPISIYWGNIDEYNWKVKDFKGVAKENLIIYEMLFRDFTGTEGKANGNGTVRQAIEKIDYFKWLGVNAVELMPIMEFAGNISWGYNTNFYMAVDKAYGTPDDYKEFIDLCHQNGIAVILDIVFNQADLHPWYTMYMPGSNPFFNRNAPHAYSVLNDWNQGYPLVQEYWYDVLRYWLEVYHVDGFRFDLVKGLGDNNSYANSGDAATNNFNQSRVDRMIALQKVVNSVNPNAYFINENLAGAQEENAMAATGQLNWENFNNAGCQFAMAYSSDSNLSGMYAPSNGNRLWGSTISYLESHDEQRLAYKQDQWGVAGVKGNVEVSMQRCGAAAAQMLMVPGAHMIWMFSEMGNAQNTKDNNGGNNTDPKIVNWSLLNEPNHLGLFNSYREMILIRNANPQMFAQDVSYKAALNVANWANGRTIYSKGTPGEIYTLINPNISGDIVINDVPFDFNSNDAYKIMSKSYNSTPSFDAGAKTVTVPANCYVIVGSKALNAINDIKADTDVETALKVYGTYGSLSVAAAPADVDVYTVEGRHVGRLAEGSSLSLTPGIYIARCLGESVKTVVR